MFSGVTRDEGVYLSRKLKVLSFVAALAVVCIHSATMSRDGVYPSWARFLQNFISVSVPCWAVPFFFTVSGFLCANSRYFRGEEGYLDFLRRKGRSLGIPFVVFLLLGSIAGASVCSITNLVAHRPLLSGTFLDAPTVWEVLNQLIGITKSDPLNNGPMWYVRILLLLFVIAPFWRFVYQRFLRKPLFAVWTFAACFAVIVFEFRAFNQAIPFVGRNALCLHFVIGLIFAAHPLLLLPKKPKKRFVILFILMSLAVLLSVAAALADLLPWSIRLTFFQFLPFIWIPTIGLLYDCWGTRLVKMERLPKIFDWSFWLYCVHGSVFTIVVGAGHFILGEETAAVLIWMPCCFLIDVFGALSLALVLNRWFPKIFSVLTGGRV